MAQGNLGPRKGRTTKPRAAAVPQLLACPSCGLFLEGGRAAGGVAFHDCKHVQNLRGDATLKVEAAMGRLLHMTVERGQDCTASDLAKLLHAVSDAHRALAPPGEANGQTTQGLLDYLRAD